MLMDEIDAMLDALSNAVLEGDSEAAVFLCMFGPWAMQQKGGGSRSPIDRVGSSLE